MPHTQNWIASSLALLAMTRMASALALLDMTNYRISMARQPAVYIMASRRNGTLYTGVTSNLPQRVWHHRNSAVGGFTKQYVCKTLVWYELHSTMVDAITREKQLKGGSRKKKLALIEASNPAWQDLFDDLM